MEAPHDDIKLTDELISRIRSGTAGARDYQELIVLLERHTEPAYVQHLRDQLPGDVSVHINTSEPEWQSMLGSILNADKQQIPEKPVRRMNRNVWWMRAAAIVLLITGIAMYYHYRPAGKEMIVDQPVMSKTDILPGGNKATLTLSDGKEIALGSDTSETITDGGLSIENNHGRLIYRETGVAAMNTMTTPRGGQYQLTLVDGTKVWLNAASSITYPTNFTGEKREVVITGEAYFEVARNKQKPFIVKTPTDAITVLGTSFNVNAYAEEEGVKTSLLEGSVSVGGTLLQPGQAYQHGQVRPTDLQQDVAWKNGLFNFNGASLQQVMRQLERWYDIQVKYEGQVSNDIFKGKMYRNVQLSDVLEVLQRMGVTFRMEGKTVIVSDASTK